MPQTIADWRALLALSAELAELVTGDAVAAASHALDGLYRLTGADEGFLVFSLLALPEETRAGDLLLGLRPVHCFYNRRGAERRRLGAAFYADPARILQEACARAQAPHLGQPRAFLRRELVPDAVWRREPYVTELLAQLGVTDRLFGGAPVAPNADVTICLDRLGPSRPFGARERDVLRAFVDHHVWFLRRLAQSVGLGGDGAGRLSPRETATLRLLLTGLTQRAIAQELGTSAYTAHEYVKGVYVKLGVRTRAQLVARFADGPPPLPVECAAGRGRYPGPRRRLGLAFTSVSHESDLD